MKTSPAVRVGRSKPTPHLSGESLRPAPESFGVDRAILFVFDQDQAADLENNSSVEARQQIKRACDAPEVQLLFSEALSRDQDEALLVVRAEPASTLLERHAEKIELEKRLTGGGYAEFSRDRKHLFEQHAGRQFFTSLERQRLLLSMLEVSNAYKIN
jgi:5'-deoxynucleotidase YfbR-like HD superfamily hydrolase